METQTIALQNGSPFVPDMKVSAYCVEQGTAYLFAVEQKTDGTITARYTVAVFNAGEWIVPLPAVERVQFVLTGALHTRIRPLAEAALLQPDADEALRAALMHESQNLNARRAESPVAADIAEVLSAEDRAAALASCAQRLSQTLYSERAESLRTEQERLGVRQQTAEHLYSASLERIAAVFDGVPAATDETSEHDSALVCAARLVAQHNGMTLTALPGKAYAADAVQELAKDNNVRLREVMLASGWWKKDNGALFCYYVPSDDENAVPVPAALLPQNSGRRYVLVDGITQERRNLDAQLAAHIAPAAYMFYRAFGSEPVSFKQVVQFIAGGMKNDFLWFLVLGVLSALVGLLIPEMTRMFMDTIIPEAAKNMAFQITILAVLCIFSAAVFDFVKTFCVLRMETKSDFSLQAAVVDRLLKLPAAFFKNYTAGELATKTMAVSQIRSMLSGTVIVSLMTFLFSLLYLVQLFKYNSYLLRWGLIFCTVPVLATVIVTIVKYHWNKELAALDSRINGLLLQFITGVSKLTGTASEKRAFSVWSKEFIHKNDCTIRSSKMDRMYDTFKIGLPVAVNLLFYAIFMKALAEKKIPTLTTGGFLAFMAAYTTFQTALVSSASSITQSIMVLPLYEQAKTILQAKPEIHETKPAVAHLAGAIEVNHISFRYSSDAPLVLKDVSLKIKPGEFVAIVGGSGSGKSTLLRLLLGFEQPESGSIFYDDQELDSLDAGSVRRNLGVVLQNGSLMQGSLFQNIVGSTGLTLDDAWEAARMVGLDEDIKAMPMGMHSMIPAGGGTLSGGQRQRLIIARAIVRRPNILLFDEATSALDNRTQAQVSESLESLKVTRIVIAHRLSTIINADRIYVLNNGVIEETGTYSELMARDGFFASFARRQQV